MLVFRSPRISQSRKAMTKAHQSLKSTVNRLSQQELEPITDLILQTVKLSPCRSRNGPTRLSQPNLAADRGNT
jgi:hypothetical protein